MNIAFLVVAGMNVLAVGEKAQLTARAYPGYPPQRLGDSPFDVSRQSQWVSSDADVATVATGGTVTARAPGAAEITASHKGASHTLPLLVADRRSNDSLSRYVGTWSGEGIMTCERLSGIGKNVCDFDGRGVPDRVRHPVELTMTVDGEVLTGTLRLYQSPSTGPIQATLLDDGELAIGGTLGGDEHPVVAQLRDWRLRRTRGGRLVGTVTVDCAFVNVYGAQFSRQRFEIDGLPQVR